MASNNFLDLFLEPIIEALSPEVAQALVNLRVNEHTEAEIQQLRANAEEGELTAEEKAKYEEFVEAVDVISIIQSKARRFLDSQS